MSLSDFITLLSTKKNIFEQDFQDITLQVFEEDGKFSNKISPSKSCETTSRRSQKASYYNPQTQPGEIVDLERLDSQQACYWNLATEEKNNNSPKNFREAAAASFMTTKIHQIIISLQEGPEEINKREFLKRGYFLCYGIVMKQSL